MWVFDHGVFQRHRPEVVPRTHPFFGHPNVEWLKSDRGVDWYDITTKEQYNPSSHWWVCVDAKSGRIRAQSAVPDTLFPLGQRLIETREQIDQALVWDGKAFVAP